MGIQLRQLQNSSAGHLIWASLSADLFLPPLIKFLLSCLQQLGIQDQHCEPQEKQMSGKHPILLTSGSLVLPGGEIIWLLLALLVFFGLSIPMHTWAGLCDPFSEL